jgi:hypothetical protein
MYSENNYLLRFLKFCKEFVRPVFAPPLDSVRPSIRAFHRRLRYFFAWTFSLISNLLLPVSPDKKRLLLIYDTSKQPFSIGDILTMQAVSLATRKKYNVDKIDFAIIFDPNDPASTDSAFDSITSENVLYHLSSVLPVAQANQHLGSLFIFDSYLHLQRYVADCVDLYHLWPSRWKYAVGDYLFYDAFDEVFYDYFKTHGSIVQLTCRPFLVEWARAFYHDHLSQLVPVTVNIRNNKLFQTHRNSILEVWLQFFEYCESRYPVKFIIICSWNEIDERLRGCSNVLLAKDHRTGIEQDLALIHTSAIHMGVGSGPYMMAIFNSKPYFIANNSQGLDNFKSPDMIVEIEPGIQQFCFSGPLQRMSNGVETVDLLITEFARMWQAVDLKHWQSHKNIESKYGSKIETWLR